MPSTRRSLRFATAAALGALFLGGGLAGTAAADTLEEALIKAYLYNPTLEAARAELRATDELVPQALSGYRPTVSINGQIGAQDSEVSGETPPVLTDGFEAPGSVDLTVNQPVYRGGRTEASIDQAEALVRAQRFSLTSIEQDVLLNAITAYLDVLRDLAIVELNKNNEVVLARQLEATRDRFEFGEVTKTDVSQSESRLSQATAQRVAAEGQLEASRAVYRQFVGDSPGTLTWPQPPADLPADEPEARTMAETYNPDVIAAEYVEVAAAHGVKVVYGELLPQVSLIGTVESGTDIWDSTDGRTDSASVVAQVTIPLYQAGQTESRVREAKQRVVQRRDQIDAQRRAAAQFATDSWQALTTARAQIVAFRDQVAAAEVALDGVKQEQEVGYRTVLDVLDAEQELLTARVNLVTAEHDEVVAAFRLLAAVGRLTAQGLMLRVPYYDVEAYYGQVRNKSWGITPPDMAAPGN
jgi:outer membrane protein/adhesin transport system outer membrane protein